METPDVDSIGKRKHEDDLKEEEQKAKGGTSRPKTNR
jgi:hypothetical protein